MFSKSRINELNARTDQPQQKGGASATPANANAPSATSAAKQPAGPKPPASVLSADLVVTGNLKTTGDIQIEGTVKGDIYAHLLTVGENAIVTGEVVGDDVIITGKIKGRVRALKVRLTSTAQVQGDIVHKALAIESGAHFEGSVVRQDDPLSEGKDDRRAQQTPVIGQPKQKQATVAAAGQSQTTPKASAVGQ
ncbi:MAG: polymer-forming cytoskeletal protein [Rhodobacter sp.]|nr:polymer-forming cytoskeletal protein [Rhodobacter sp.]MCY4167143.1 polymer-forming cytoskeletal protein [Rhodobacter sp.]MCY4241279.1 polymer-forming cytoskeletal protein [Rhodobacter sp.]